MARDDLSWISLVDFSPGIYAKYGAASTLGKDGAARIDDGIGTTPRYTYGCYGDPDGGLRPLPGLIRSYTKDTSDVTEPAGFVRPHMAPPDDPNLGTLHPPAPQNDVAFTQHPTTRELGTGRRAKIAVIDMLTETGVPTELSPLVPGSFPDWTSADYRDREGITRPDSVHMITCFRQDPVPIVDDPDSMFPRYGRLRSQWREFKLGQYDPTIGFDLYDYEWIFCQHADIAEEASYREVDPTNLPLYRTVSSIYRLAVYNPASVATVIPLHMSDGFGGAPHDGWGRGTLAKGRAAASTPNDVDGTHLDVLNRPGNRTVFGCFQSFTFFSPPDHPTEEFLANFFTYMGADNFDLSYGQVDIKPNAHSAQMSYFTLYGNPEYLVEHQDRFVGLTRDYGVLLGMVLSQRGGLLHPRTVVRYTAANAARIGWKQPNIVANDGRVQFMSDIWKFSGRDDPAAAGFPGSFLGTVTNTTTPGSLKAAPNYPPGTVAGNQTTHISCAFTWQNSLVFVPETGEGSVVKGPLEEGTLIRSSTIIPSGGYTSVPVSLPTGVAYGTREGVAFWTGEAAQIISPQLDGDFWIAGEPNECHEPDGYRAKARASMGRFGYLHPFLYAPNNWLMDTRTGGWFRLVDPDDPNPYTHLHYHPNDQGEMYAARGCYDDTHQNVLELFSPTTRAREYQWVSQPLMSTLNREQLVERINLVAQGQGTITITLIGIDGTEQSETTPVNSDRTAEQLVIPTSMNASDLTVIIRSTGVDDREAPTVHAVHLGTRDGRQQTRP